MARSFPSNFLVWLKANLLSQVTQLNNVTENCYMGETLDFLDLVDSDYPRIEMQIVGAPGNTFVTQRQRQSQCVFSLQGYMKRPERPHSDDAMLDIADFHADVERVIFSIHDQVLAGDPSVPENFIKLDAMTEAYIVHNIEPDTSMFIFNFTTDFDFI